MASVELENDIVLLRWMLSPLSVAVWNLKAVFTEIRLLVMVVGPLE